MAVPRNSNGSDPEYQTEETILSESVFNVRQSLVEIVAFIRREKGTGKLVIDMNKGGTTRITFLQKQAVDIDYGK